VVLTYSRSADIGLRVPKGLCDSGQRFLAGELAAMSSATYPGSAEIDSIRQNLNQLQVDILLLNLSLP